MFTKKEAKHSDKKVTIFTHKNAIPSILAADSGFTGNIISEGAVEIEGSLEGNVACSIVTIRKSGSVKGDITAHTANIYGELTGTVKAEVIKVFSGATITGVVLYNSLSVEDGASIEGHCRTKENYYIGEAVSVEQKELVEA